MTNSRTVNCCTGSHVFVPIDLQIEVMTPLPQTDSAVAKAYLKGRKLFGFTLKINVKLVTASIHLN